MVTAASDTVRVVVPATDGVAATGSAETLAEALEMADTPDAVQVVVIGQGTGEVAAALGADGFGDLTFSVAEIGPFAPARWTAVLVDHVRAARLVLLPASANGRDLAPRLAAALGRPLVAGAVAVGFDRSLLARASGRALAEIPTSEPFVATLQPGVRNADRTGPDEPVAPVELDLSGAAEGRDVDVLEVLGPDAATMDLAEAPFILGAGAGLGSREVVEQMVAVADVLDASVGATRVITDEGWVDHERQIGTTGVVVDPRVYIAFGVSGAVQHTAGLGDPELTISVNTDAHCPMMEMADLAIVADAPAVVAELHRRLHAEGAGRDEET